MQEEELPFFNLILPSGINSLEVESYAKEYLQKIGARRASIMLIQCIEHGDIKVNSDILKNHKNYIIVYRNRYVN